MTIAAGTGEQRSGLVYAYDKPNGRVLAYDKSSGDFVAQYRLAGDQPDWADLRGMYVIPGVDRRPAHARLAGRPGTSARPSLRPVGDTPGASSSAAPSPSTSSAAAPSRRAGQQAHQEALARGGRVIPLRDANPTRRTPVVTLGLIVACLARLRLRADPPAAGRRRTALDAFITELGLVPADLTAAWAAADCLSQETATLVTSQFLHGGWLHLLGNLLYLWIFGNNVEDRFGRLGFLAFYLAGGVAGRAHPGRHRPGVHRPDDRGVRGDRGVLGAYLVLFPRARITSLVFLGFFYQLIDVPAVIVLGFWFALQFIDGLASLGVTDAAGGVAFFAHIGGFLVGVLVGLLVTRRSPPDRARARGIIRPWTTRLIEMVVESVRVHMLSSRHVVILKETGPRPLPPDLDRAVGGERDRDEAPGPDARTTADPRPVREHARGARRARRPGRHLGSGR